MSQFADWFESNHGSCILKSTAGVDCPGCGAQRSFTALLRGDFAAAWDFYPPIYILLLTLLIIIFTLVTRHPRRNELIKWSAYATFAFIFVSYAVKLISGNAW